MSLADETKTQKMALDIALEDKINSECQNLEECEDTAGFSVNSSNFIN